MTLSNKSNESKEENTRIELYTRFIQPETPRAGQQPLISSPSSSTRKSAVTVNGSNSNSITDHICGECDSDAFFSGFPQKSMTAAYNDLTVSTITIPSVLFMDAADLDLISPKTSSSNSSSNLIGSGRSTDCDGQQNLPVPSLRHRFGLNRPLSSPSPDFTSPGRIFNSRTCTNESDFPLRSPITTEDHVKRRTPEGNTDLSLCGNEDTLSERTSFLSPVPTNTAPVVSGGCQTTVAQNINRNLEPSTSIIPHRTCNSTNEGFECSNGTESTERDSCIQNTDARVDSGNRAVPEACASTTKTEVSHEIIPASSTEVPQMNETKGLTTKADDNVLKWDYAGDLASQKLPVDLTRQTLAFEEVDRISDGKESMEGDVVSVPFTWPSFIHSSTRAHANWIGRKMRSVYYYGVRDRPQIHSLSMQFTKGSSANTLSHGSFISSPDPEEIEYGALTVPLGKLMSDSGNMYSLRSESSLVPMNMDDGLDELESDEEPLPHKNVVPVIPTTCKDREQLQHEEQQGKQMNSNEELSGLISNLENGKEELLSADTRRSSLNEVDPVCLSASQTMLNLRHHADRVLEATETAERRLRERLNLISVTVSDPISDRQQRDAESETAWIPEPRARLSHVQVSGRLDRKQQKHQLHSGCPSTPQQPNVLTAVRVDEPVALEVASNSTSWTSGSEDIVTNRPKSHTIPTDLPLLQFDLSSGDEKSASTTSARTQSTNATPIAAPGATQRTPSPPFTEPTIMTSVTPLMHTPGGGRPTAGESEWDSKRSSLVEEHRNIFAEQSYASKVNDEFCGLLATRQEQSGLSSPLSTSWNPVAEQTPASVISVKAHGDSMCDCSVGMRVNLGTASSGAIKSSQHEIHSDLRQFTWYPAIHYSRPSNFFSVSEINLLDRRDLEKFKEHIKVDPMASTLSLPVGENEYRERISTGPNKRVFAILSDSDECNPQFAFGKHSSIRKGIPNVDRLSNYVSPMRYHVEPHATSGNLASTVDQPLASSTRLDSADAAVTSDSHSFKEKLAADFLVSRPPRSESNFQMKALSADKRAAGYSVDPRNISKGESKKSPCSSDKSSTTNYAFRKSSWRTTTQDHLSHSSQDNDGLSSKSDAHSAEPSSTHDQLSTSKQRISNSVSLFTSQLRYMLLKHRLKLARAKDAYLLRRRVVEQLELLLHKVWAKERETMCQKMPEEWDTDTSSLVTDIGDESFQDHSIIYNSRSDPIGKQTQRKDRNRARSSVFRSKIVEPSTSKTGATAGNAWKNSNVAEQSTSPIIPDPHDTFCATNRIYCSVSCQTEEQIASCESVTNENSKQLVQHETFRVNTNQSLCELRDRAEKQLAEMLYAIKQNERFHSDNLRDPIATPEPDMMSATARLTTWTEERSDISSFRSGQFHLSRNDKTQIASQARASRGGVTWFQAFSPIPPFREAASVKQPLVKVVRESPRFIQRDRVKSSTLGDTFVMEAARSVLTGAVPELDRSTTGNMRGHMSTSRRTLSLGVDVHTDEDDRNPLDEEFDLPTRDPGKEDSSQKAKSNPTQMRENGSPTCENQEPMEHFSGLVATPRGIAYSVHGDQDRHSSRTYRVMNVRSPLFERDPCNEALEEEQQLSVDLQTLFRQRMSRWISRSRERQKRIQLAAFERRFNKDMQTERAVLFRVLQPDCTGTMRSNAGDSTSSFSGCSRDIHEYSTTRVRQPSVVAGDGFCREHQQSTETNHGSQFRRLQGRTITLKKVRPQLPVDQQRRALENKLMQLRTNRLRMKIYGEKVLRSVLQRRAPWSVSFKEI